MSSIVVTIIATTLVILIAVFGISGWGQQLYVRTFVSYPDTWILVKPGMISHEARELIGEPDADGRGLKVLDRWRQIKLGAEMHLDVWFENENTENAVIMRVVRWKHFLGKDIQKTFDPPREAKAEKVGGTDASLAR